MKACFKIISILFLIVFGSSVFGQKYNCENLKKDLLPDANAVIRSCDQRLVKTGVDKAVLTITKAVTVLNENGKKAAYLYIPYNKFIQIKKIEGTIYDSDGKKDRRIKADEINDYSNIASYSLYEDSRIKFIQTETNDFPYTIEYQYEIVLNGFIQFPEWYILPDYNISLENGRYSFIIPGEEEFEFKTLNFNKEPVISSDGKNQIYTWELNNIPVIKEEPFTANMVDLIPVLYIKTESFSYGGKSGSLASWESFGEWLWELMKEKDYLDEYTRIEIHNLIKDCGNDREKINILYKYMQDKVRYVNISLGLGGMEPIPAEQVQKVSYGDCKALTNYMRALLGFAGIESVYTLVNAGDNPNTFISGFPSSQFNHAILMVPLEKDSVWLECTSQRLPSNFLGGFTDDRNVLFITQDGGAVGKTPAFTLKENSVHTKTSIIIDKDFNSSIERIRSFKGTFFDNEYSSFLHYDDINRKRRILNDLRLSEFSLDSINYNVNLDERPVITERIWISDNLFLSSSNEYFSLGLNSVTEITEIPKRIRNRNFNYYQRRSVLKTDSICISLPDNVKIVSFPNDIEIDTDFGRYLSNITINGNSVVYTRQIELYKADLPPERYIDFYEFCRSMNSADNQVILLKQNSE